MKIGGATDLTAPGDYEARMDLELQVPARTEIDLRVVNGTLEATGIQGLFQANSVNGTITLSDMEGAGSAHAVNGGIKLSFARVPVGTVDAKTVNGDIEAAFPRTMNAKINIKTLKGDVFTDFPTTNPNSGRSSKWNREFSFNIGSGGSPEHRFETIGGTIQIKQR